MTVLMAFLALTLVAAQTAAPSPTTLKVRVVDASTSAALPGAWVIYTCFRSDGAFREYRGSTAANGEITAAVEPGECLVHSELDKYAPSLSARRYELAAGETATAVIRLVRYATVAGTVRDERGTPLPNIKVFVQNQIHVAGQPQWSGQAVLVTDDAGRFSLSGAPRSAPYRLDVPSLELQSPSDAFVVAPGDTRTVELRGRRLPTFSISGRLQRPGVNLGFVTASLERADSSPARPVTFAATQADAAGAFTFADVPRGAYRIRVDTSARTGGYAPSDILAANLPITVDGNRTDVVVALIPGYSISGRVRFEGSTPAPGDFVNVLIQFRDASRGTGPMAQGTVGTRFWTRALPPGKHLLTLPAGPPGDWGVWRLKNAMLNGQDITETSFDTSAGGVFDVLVTFTDRQTEIRGVVRDSVGNEAPEATVAVFSTNPDVWTNTNRRRVRIWEATQHGRFSVTNLPPGDYFAAAVPSDEVPFDAFVADVEWLRQLAASATRVTLEEDKPVVIDLVMRRPRR